MQKWHLRVSTTVEVSSESYEVAFPILSFHADVQILGQKFRSIRKEREKADGGGVKERSQESWGGKVVLGKRFDTRFCPASV